MRVLERKIFEQVLKKYGDDAVAQAIQIYVQTGHSLSDRQMQLGRREKRVRAAFTELFESQPPDTLYNSYLKVLGVSEPATVPRQTSRAEVTPKERKVGKSF